MGNVKQDTAGNTLKVLAGGGFGSVGDSVTFTPTAGNLLNDGFESGDMSATTVDGFAWGANNKTSVVTMDNGVPTAIYNNTPISNVNTDVPPKDWTAKTGSNCLRFRYSAGDAWTEQRFDPTVGYPILWVSYWLRVPVNYSRGAGTNNKQFKLWMGDISKYDLVNEVAQFTTQDWPNGTDSTSMDVVLAYDRADGTTGGGATYENYVTPADSGKWMHVVYRMEACSSVGASDGHIAWYRRWDGDANYTTISDLDNIEVPISPESIANGYNGWGSGYIMGYANAPYVEDTEWLLDDFKMSTESLL